jgi:uncharacterized protein (DUF924 family)
VDSSDVLAFWFGDGDDAAIIARNDAHWWSVDPLFDAEIVDRFSAVRDDALTGKLEPWSRTPHGRLALIILIDQFSRNIHRDDPRAFAHDPLARRWCEEGLKAHADYALRPIERVFFYLPLQHSEASADQDLSVALYRTLRDSVADTEREAFTNYLSFAERHRAIINRFGRFPHRNAVLERKSTSEELAFLKQPNSSF